MKKTVTILAVLLFLITNTHIQAQDAQYEVQSFDTLFHAQVGADAFYTEYENPGLPLKLHVVDFDLNQPGLEIRSVLSNNSLKAGNQTTSDMSRELEDENTFVVAGVNGDFYSGGSPTNVQIVDGEMLRTPISREIIAFDDTFSPYIARGTTFSGQVSGEGISAAINNINAARGADQIVAYNSFYGNSTGTNAFGTEVALQLQGEVAVNQPAQYVVTRIEENVGNMSLGDDDLILSAHGTAISNFDGLEVGDELTVQINLNPLENAILEAVGGNGQFLVDGEVVETWAEWHPRTAVGFSQDTTRGYFMVVDGRQNASRGMTTGQMGYFMASIGAANAINLDGGGSSTMLVQDEVMNNPSDGTERPVANALFLTLPYSGNGEVNRIKLRTSNPKVFLSKNRPINVLGFDEDHKFRSLPANEVEFTVDESLGSISTDGVFTASLEAGSGYIYGNYDGLEDSTFVTVVGAGRINLTPANLSIDTSLTFSPNYRITDTDGFEQNIARGDIEWSLTNPDIGEIDDDGNFSAHTIGETGVIATFATVTDTAWVEVIQKEGYVAVDDFNQVGEWNLETTNLDEALVELSTLESEDGINISYTLPANTTNAELHLRNDIFVDGVPGFANVVLSNDGADYIMNLDITNQDDGLFKMASQRVQSEDITTFHYEFEENRMTRVTPGAAFYFPITLEAINIRLPQNNTDEDIEGYFRLYELGVSYTETPVSNEKEEITIPQDLDLHQNYPNPFNPTTQISFNLPAANVVSLDVFDVLGRKVATLVEGRLSAGTHTYNFDAKNLSSGIYLYQLKTNEATLSKKMMLIK